MILFLILKCNQQFDVDFLFRLIIEHENVLELLFQSLEHNIPLQSKLHLDLPFENLKFFDDFYFELYLSHNMYLKGYNRLESHQKFVVILKQLNFL